MGNLLFAQAEESALRTYLHTLDLEAWWDELKQLGLEHPCKGCEQRCAPRCRFWDVRRHYGGSNALIFSKSIARIERRPFS